MRDRPSRITLTIFIANFVRKPLTKYLEEVLYIKKLLRDGFNNCSDLYNQLIVGSQLIHVYLNK
jgi:hypothetical protein